MVLLIIIPIKWLFHWEYTLFSDKPISLKHFITSMAWNGHVAVPHGTSEVLVLDQDDNTSQKRPILYIWKWFKLKEQEKQRSDWLNLPRKKIGKTNRSIGAPWYICYPMVLFFLRQPLGGCPLDRSQFYPKGKLPWTLCSGCAQRIWWLVEIARLAKIWYMPIEDTLFQFIWDSIHMIFTKTMIHYIIIYIHINNILYTYCHIQYVYIQVTHTYIYTYIYIYKYNMHHA